MNVQAKARPGAPSLNSADGGAPGTRPLSEPVRRTEEIEDPTNLYFVHVISRHLTTSLARLHVHPNVVSITGMACGIAAGFAYFSYQNPFWSCAGFALMIVWHVMDGTDGQLARLTRKQSELGKVLDGICDYVTFTAVYLALAFQMSQQHGALAWLLVAVSGLCHALQSAGYERQRQDYETWGWDRGHAAPRTGASPVSRTLHAAYARVQALATGPAATRDRLDALLLADPHRAPAIRRRYRDVFARPIRRWSILSANTRTITIFLCVLAGTPMLYFVIETAGFSLILVVLTIRQRARFTRFVTDTVQ